MTIWLRSMLVLLISMSLHAEEYTLQSILTLTEKNNHEIKIARADLQTASAEKLAAISTALPQIDLTAGYNRNFKENLLIFPDTGGDTPSFFPTDPIKISFDNEFRLNATLRQTLFSFRVGYAIGAARMFDKYTSMNYEYTRQMVFTTVKASFYQALLLKEVYQVTMDSEASAKANYENVKFRFESGLVSEFDLLQAETRWQNAIPATGQAKQQFEASLNNLKKLAGLPIDGPAVLQGSLDTYPDLPEPLVYENVVEKRPDYNSLVYREKLQKINVKAARADFLPTLEGTFTYSYSAQSDQFELGQDFDNYILGITLNVPIFSGGNNIANVRRANADVERVTSQIGQLEDNIRVQLRNLRLRMEEAQQRIEANLRTVNTARRAFEIAETRVANGLSTQVELKDNRVALDQAKVNRLQAIFDYLTAYFEWELATGNVTFSG